MNVKTQFLKFDSHRCKACWKCIGACPANVIGKVAFLWHKHARILHPDNCMGCLICAKVCEYGAFRPYVKKMPNE